VAVASAGTDASLHLAPDQHPTTQGFLQAGCPSCHPTNSIKALNFQLLYWKKTEFPNIMCKSAF